MGPRNLIEAAVAAHPGDEVLVIPLRGRLGNQLFQFGAGMALAERTGGPVRFVVGPFPPTLIRCVGDAFVPATDAELLRCAELVGTDPVSRLLRSLQKRVWLPYRRARGRPERRLVIEESLDYDERFERVGAPSLVSGYFQNLAYFDDVLDQVCDLVIRELGLVRDTTAPGDAVGLHFRRGDYVPREWALPMTYYDRAMAVIDAEVSDPRLVVFSDDSAFADLMVEHLVAAGRHAAVAPAAGAHDDPAVATLMAMSRVDHLVMANSSLSWWAAALGDRLHGGPGRIVTMPDTWFPGRRSVGLACRGWRRLEC